MLLFKKYILIIFLSVIFCLFSKTVLSQINNNADVSLAFNIPAISLIDFVVDDNQVLTYSYSSSGPNQVEQVIMPTTGNNTWLNYSSIVNNGSSSYITVHISLGTLPGDVQLDVMVGADVGAGMGTVGTSSGQITLASYPQNIIYNIGSCYTGIGVNHGHQLSYIWENLQGYIYYLNNNQGQAIAVTYTINSTE